MATTLLVNPGSTSQKFALYKEGKEQVSLAYEETGSGFDVCVTANNESGHCQPITENEYQNALTNVVQYLINNQYLENEEALDAVGVRVVAPGNTFTKHCLVDDEYLAELEQKISLAPLHIPPVLKALRAIQQKLSTTKLVAISDSAFHTTRPEFVWRYSLPKKDADEFEIKRYGYHGLSVSSVSRRLESVFGTMPERTIVCHIGGGVSLTALKNGESFDTSMGFAPMSGMIMSGRAGGLDGSALLGLFDSIDIRGEELHRYLNQKSGFVGLTGVGDMRLILNNLAEHDSDTELAFNMFLHQFTKIVGSYVAVLGGLDAVVLTATASVRNPELRSLVLKPLAPLGILFDENKNTELIGQEGLIESADSKVKIAVLKTDELGEMDRVTTSFV